MPRGKIKSLVSDRGFGFIRPDDGSTQVFFHASKVKNPLDFSQLQTDMPVEYDATMGPKGLQATSVRPIPGAVIAPAPAPAPQPGVPGGYRFHNPQLRPIFAGRRER